MTPGTTFEAKRSLRKLEIKGKCRRVPSKGNSVDDGTCDTPGQNDIRKSETEQPTKAKAMQQSIFPRPVGLVVIQEPLVEISQQCHKSYVVKYAKTQENKRKPTRVTVQAQSGTRHKNQRRRGKSYHHLRYVHVSLVAMLKGDGFAMRVGRRECRGKTMPYFDSVHSDTPPNEGENSQASYQREYDCFHCPMLHVTVSCRCTSLPGFHLRLCNPIWLDCNRSLKIHAPGLSTASAACIAALVLNLGTESGASP
jgi:hypothetical protein